MNTDDEKFAVILIDLPGRVWPIAAATAFSPGDLMQLAGKARQFYSNLSITEGEAAVISAFIPCIRRRRR